MKTRETSQQHLVRFKTSSSLELHSVEIRDATYRGKRALRVRETQAADNAEHSLVILPNSDFQNGTIEARVAGLPRAGAPVGSRGFIGIAFRVAPRGEQFECFYLRPTNGRAADQLRRNHATQYISHPDFPWYKLREENPGVYESYTDLVTGAWTKMKIVVLGTHAQLYVNDAKQPCLIVNDLKLGERRGAIALWIGSGTDAYFSQLAWRSS